MPTGVNRIPEAREWILKKRCTMCGETKPWAKFSPKRYFEDGSVSVVASRCTKCHHIANKKYKQAWQERNADQIRARKAEWQRNRRAQLRREASSNAFRIPAKPLQRLLWQNFMIMEEPSWDDMALEIGVPDRSIRRVLKQEHVSYVFADKVCTHFGVRLEELWPDEFEELAA